MDACFANEDCVGLDFAEDSNKNCWLHLDADNLKNLGDADGVMHIQLEDRCHSGTGMSFYDLFLFHFMSIDLWYNEYMQFDIV